MLVISHDDQPWEEWRPGVQSRAWATASVGAQQVRIAEQTLDAGCEAPLHWHYFEENITVVEGCARVTVGGASVEIGPGHTVIVPSMEVHGFGSVGAERLRVIAAMGWPINEMNYVSNPNEIWRAGEVVDDGRRRKLRLAADPVHT